MEIVIYVFSGIMFLFFGTIMFMAIRTSYKDSKAARALLRDGIAASARVHSASQTGSWLNDNPQIAMVLEVTRPDGSTFGVTQTIHVPVLDASRFQAGKIVRVKYRPEDENRVAVEGMYLLK
ncbi:DUF3592 domain-containing protein [Schauerella aestuarii]|uniref:hypothetical protein n=1 Tax=Schauerella aestuarii TaxID=2511204 RepID=UPI00136F9875|nr:hypothetical protein [Achromobacter aestuarii]MYZ41619.1 hypothetical protein [Achromobacter aestuarii]